MIAAGDCVVGGFRYLQKKRQVGSLLLGLFNDRGKLDIIGFCSSTADEERPALTKRLEKLVGPPGFTGFPSRHQKLLHVKPVIPSAH